MSNKTMFYGLASLLTSTALAGLLITNNTQAQSPRSRQNPHHPSTQNTPPQGMMMHHQMDEHFISMMIPHHEQAVEMADLAISRAKRTEIKKLAIAIKKDQTREIEQMRTWYKQWYGKEPTQAMAGMMGMMGRKQGMMGRSMHPHRSMHLDTLKNASDFDQEFIREMIPHHQMAVMMARMAINRATHPEIHNLAQSIIKTQTAEIEQMRQWYQAWYQ